MSKDERLSRRMSDTILTEQESIPDDGNADVTNVFISTLAFAAATVASLYLIGVATTPKLPGED